MHRFSINIHISYWIVGGTGDFEFFKFNIFVRSRINNKQLKIIRISRESREGKGETKKEEGPRERGEEGD